MRKPIFSKLETSGQLKEMMLNTFDNYTSNETSEYLITPYSDLIPMVYISCTPDYYNYYKPISTLKKVITNKPLLKFIWDSSNNITSIKKMVNMYLYNDDPLNFNVLVQSSHAHSDYNGCFNGWAHSRVKMRSWKAFISAFTFCVKNQEEYIPHIIATTLPENLEYHKLRAIAGFPVDLSKVIVLIDRELDTPRFAIKPARKMYREFFRNSLLDSCCDIWEVPLEFIIKSCFLGNYEQTGSITQRRKAKNELIDLFLTPKHQVEYKVGIDLVRRGEFIVNTADLGIQAHL